MQRRPGGGVLQSLVVLGQGLLWPALANQGVAPQLQGIGDLPVAQGASQGELELLAPQDMAGGCDVLLVEDNAEVRTQAARLLVDLGCRVTPVANAAGAFEHLCADRPVDLMITDLQLTGGISGRELASAARDNRPDLKVLYMSGSLEEFGVRASEPRAQFLAKPFGRAQLAAAVSSALARYPVALPQSPKSKASARRTKEYARHG